MGNGALTVMFEDPFWIGLFEFTDDDGLHVCKMTFGAEPSLQQVIEFIDNHGRELQYSEPVITETKQRAANPKRILREARKATSSSGIGTKSQQALKAQHEMQKSERAVISRQQREEEERLRFEQKQVKRREKHKGH